MLAFTIRRLFQSIGVMLAVSLIAFVMFTFVGDPVDQMVGLETTIEERNALREQLGLNDPTPVQFLRFVGNAIQGDFGISYQFKRPVATILGERMPATLELALVSAILSLILGIPMGVYTALRRERWLSKVFLTISLVGVSLPTFLIGIIFILAR